MINELSRDIVFHSRSSSHQARSSGFESAMSWLEDTSVLDYAHDIVLQPVTAQNPHALLILRKGLVEAWADPELRRGYLPHTPTDSKGAESIINHHWLPNPSLLVYLYGQFSEMCWMGYTTLEITHKDDSLMTEVAYGLFNRENQGQGYTSKAIELALNTIEYACYTFGLPLIQHQTNVSDNNHSSMGVLRKNGYILTQSDPLKESPIMGGNIQLATKVPSLALSSKEYPLW